MSQQIWKLVIIAEEVLSKKLIKVIKESGAEGNRNVRSTGDPSVSHTLSNVKIEVLTGTRELADAITKQIEEKFYADYSIITYISEVIALRDHKF
jgi:hypothetical protein